MKKLIKVDGHPNFARDVNTGAVVNINKQNIIDAKKAKEEKKKNIQRMDKMENDITEIKELLQKLLKE